MISLRMIPLRHECQATCPFLCHKRSLVQMAWTIRRWGQSFKLGFWICLSPSFLFEWLDLKVKCCVLSFLVLFYLLLPDILEGNAFILLFVDLVFLSIWTLIHFWLQNLHDENGMWWKRLQSNWKQIRTAIIACATEKEKISLPIVRFNVLFDTSCNPFFW